MCRVAIEGECGSHCRRDLDSAVKLDGPLKVWEGEAGPTPRCRVVHDAVICVGDVEATRGNVGREQQGGLVLAH
eukprot:scaffold90394_cov24-Tisochrysis_lutea.AAC.4